MENGLPGRGLTIHCFIAHILAKKMLDQVRSGHQSGFVDPTSEKLAITSELELFTERFPLFRYSLQYQYV